MIKVDKINNCRICGSSELLKIISLPRMPFTDEFVKKNQIGTEFLSDVEIGICKSCGSTQNLNNTDMDDYYQDYTYTVQSSGFAMKFMSTLAEKIKTNFFKNSKNPKILEIGSGSGEQLKEFKKRNFKVVGIEPSKKLSDYANGNGITTITDFFDENSRENIIRDIGLIDSVVTSYTFDHIPKINDVLKNINFIMKDNGVLIIEVHDLDLISERNEYCLFEHEHYTYLNKETMHQFLTSNGFELVTYNLLDESEKRANSLLVVAKKNNNVLKFNVDVSYEINKISNLNLNISKSITRIEKFIEKNKSKKIVAYGAGGRGIMTLSAISNYDKISFIVDKNPKDKNIYAPKTNLPVYHINKLSKFKADIIIVFSFGYFDEIVEELSTRMGYNESNFVSLLNLIKNDQN